MDRPLIAVTMGDPAGIGPEVCVKALCTPEVLRTARCVVIGDKKIMQKYRPSGVEINSVQSIKEAGFIRGKIDVLDLANVQVPKLKIGAVSSQAGRASIEYLKKAVELVKAGEIDAIATAPINKTAIHKAGFRFQGHTEFFAKETNTKDYAMMFVSDNLWVILVTTHIPFNKVSQKISKKNILSTIKLAHSTLLRVRGRSPRIAVAGLNPHAGEEGIFGSEEIKKIRPAVIEAKRLGIKAEGPISADAVFYLAKVGKYDIVVSMYHDQGLIPLKLLSFNNSVNVTVGLPFVRTSVDHGTGFDIAGKGWANPSSLIQAIKVAAHFAKS